ncbi:MAG: hypothetical protein LWY06_00945 [Firmicutes bacterium]|nr:hypothetical protein [Bacillota bacterium]
MFCCTSEYKKTKGLSLVELIIMLAMLLVFIGTLFSAMIAGLRYWSDGRLRLRAQESLRECLDTMTTEMRQALPNPDPGVGTNTPTGYLSLSPAVDPTGVLFPNENTVSGDYVEFNEPLEAAYIPSNTGWTPELPTNYQKVRYFVSGGVLKRRVTKFNSSGAQSSQTEDNVVTLQDGSLSLKTTCLSPTYYEIEMTAKLSKFSYTIKTNVKTGS